MTLTDAAGVLSRLLGKLEAGKAQPGVCTAAANLARALDTHGQATAIEDRNAEV